MGWKRLAGVFVLAFVFLGLLQFSSPNILGFDGFYHAGMGEMILEEGVPDSFPWARETILADKFADLHLGYHLLLAPFVFLGPMLGAKLAAALFGAIALTVFYWFLRRKEIPHALAWTVLYAVSSSWLLYRFLLPRQMPLAVALLLASIVLLEKKKYVWLGVLSFAFVWLHPTFLFLLPVMAVFLGLRSLREKRLDYKAVLFPLAGIVASLALHPHFPANISLLYTQIFQVNLAGNLYNVEWKPWPIGEFLMNAFVVLAALVLGIGSAIKGKRLSKEALPYLLLTAFFLLYALMSRRMLEYLAPFAIITAALLSATLVRKITAGKKSILKKSIITIALAGLSFFQVVQTLAIVENSDLLPNYHGCASWLEENAPNRAVVFNHAYTFPYLFFTDRDLVYTHGLDLTYSQLKDEEKFKRYMEVLQGKAAGQEDVIIQDYDPDYLIIGKLEQDVQVFEYVVAHKENYRAVYEDEWCAVLETKNDENIIN